ncbi:MAG: hypothetical protein KDI51_16525 [Xanthomonadales bacterium]|nr:hypothetical protein [Xanthomonadales bacterium]
MSLLDRIGKQAQRVREERAAAEREKQRLEDRYEQIVAPAMEGLHDYLQALSRDLGEVQPPVQLHYQLIHYGPIVANALHEYRIEKHKRRFGYEITMAWRAKVDYEKGAEQRIHGHRRVKQLIDQLRQLHLGGVREAEHGPNGDLIEARIHPRGFLHLELTAKASAYDTYMRLSFRHLDSLGQTHKHVVAEQLDAGFYDRLGRFLIREDDELIKEQLSPELRARLQEAVGSSEPLTMLSETVLDPLAPTDEPFEVVEDEATDELAKEEIDAPPDSAVVDDASAASVPLSRQPALTEEPLDRSFSHLADKDRELLLQASLKALAPAETAVEDLTDDRQLKAAAFVLRMKLMADQLRDKD